MTSSDQWKFVDGWLACARPVPSSNFNARPAEALPELIVIHGISLPPGQYGGPYIEALFTNQLDPADHVYFSEVAHLTVSAHFLIRRDGEDSAICVDRRQGLACRRIVLGKSLQL